MSEVKEKLKQYRENVDVNKSQEELEDELGDGVEALPEEPEQPDLDIPKIDLGDAMDVKGIIEQIKQLPESKEIDLQLEKFDKYEAYARKIWVVKQSEKDSFDIKMRVVEKIDEIKTSDGKMERIVWKKKDGKYVTRTKTFYYNGLTIQDKDILNVLEADKDAAHYILLEEGARIKGMIAQAAIRTDPETSFEEYAKGRTWQGKMLDWQRKLQQYFVETFKMYFAATDEDVKHILFDDMTLYCEVAAYKSGVKSPKSEGSSRNS